MKNITIRLSRAQTKIIRSTRTRRWTRHEGTFDDQMSGKIRGNERDETFGDDTRSRAHAVSQLVSYIFTISITNIFFTNI